MVNEEGNPAALALMADVFALQPHFEWHGLFISRCIAPERRFATR